MGSTQKQSLRVDRWIGNVKLSYGHAGQKFSKVSGLETLRWVLAAFGGGQNHESR